MPLSKDATSNKPKEKKTKMVDPAVKCWRSLKKAVRNELLDCKPGDELKTLLETLQHNVQTQQVRQDVLAAFQNHFPGMFKDEQIHLFGSTVMGIAFKDSDLDFYVELPECEQSTSTSAQIALIRSILKATKKFSNFESITSPRVPMIKCTHIGTLIHCDFNSSNRFGTSNSPIIANLLNYDPRIRQLAIIIKYWMKIHQCVGINRISSYAVVWMLIFYLQTLPVPIVPSINEFQRSVPPSMVSHYNFAFDYAMPNRTENQTQWQELLLGFFQFYRDFDYHSQLICPLYGKTLTKADVTSGKTIEMRRFQQMRLDSRSLCIQDPFETVRKIPGDIGIRQFEEIVWKFGYAAEIIECELKAGETKSMLLQMFDFAKFEQYVSGKKKESEEMSKCSEISTASVLSIENGKVALQLNPTRLILNIRQRNKNISRMDKRQIRRLWTEEVIEMILHILSDIFCLDLYEQNSSSEFVKKINLIGAFGLFHERRQSYHDKTWTEEVLDSSNRFKKKPEDIPLGVSAHITADTVHFSHVSIEFKDKLRTENNNFCRTFCTQFVNNIDYLLKIYFTHRNGIIESDSVKPNSTRKKSAKELPPQRQSTATMPSTSNASRNTENPQNEFHLKPSPQMIAIIRDMLSKSVDRVDDEAAVQQFWAETVIEFVIQILNEIFQLELCDVTPDPFQKKLNVGGACDMFIERKQQEVVDGKTLFIELRESMNRFACVTEPMPLSMSAKIPADVENFESVFIEFNDHIRTVHDSFYKQFCQQFKDNIDYLLEVYFVHRHRMISKSNTLQCKFVRYESASDAR